MSGVIFFIIICIVWVKIISKFTVNGLDVLKQTDFQNITKIKTTSSKTFYTTIKNGENYLISIIDSIKTPDIKDIEDTIRQMEEIHYHYGVLISKVPCSESIKAYAETKEIKVIYIMDLLKNINQNIKVNTSNIVETKFNNNEFDPIKEKKGNSIISNLFKKPDRL